MTSTASNRAMALMKIGDAGAIAPIQTALIKETDEAIQPVFKLAMAQPLV